MKILSQVSYLCHCILSLRNQNEKKKKKKKKKQEFYIFAGKYLPSFHDEILYRKSLFKIFLTRAFLFVNRLIQFCCIFCDKLNAQLCQEIFSSRFNK